MGTALETHRLASQPRQGVGARLLRRLGGTVRNAIAGSRVLAGALRQQAASYPGIGRAEPHSADARPAAVQTPLPRRPHTVPLAPPSRPVRAPWLARLLCRRRRPARFSHPPFPTDPDALFSAETFPGLPPEFRTFLNMPLEECDPEMLRVVLMALAATIADAMPPEAGLTDAGAVFSTLWGRLAGSLDDPGPDTLPAPVLLTPAPPVPDAPVQTAYVPVRSSVPLTRPRLPARTAASPSAPMAALALSTDPPIPPNAPGASFRDRGNHAVPRLRRHVRGACPPCRCFPSWRLPPRHRSYAARASPPGQSRA